jgi:uncharacterized membrane protein
MFKKLKDWYDKQSDTTKGMIWFGLVLIVLIAIRWKAIVAGVIKGYNYYTHGTLPQ